MSTKLNLRKRKQIITEEVPEGITVVVGTKHGDYEEYWSTSEIQKQRERFNFPNRTDQQVVRYIYENFNKTLRPGESRRVAKALFYTYKALEYRKINKNNTICK